MVAQKLSSASGAEFDRLFLRQSTSDHERLIRSLQQEREDASDDDIEALINKIMPILEQHRDLATILMKKEQA
jgi:predicted outer membrane protein